MRKVGWFAGAGGSVTWLTREKSRVAEMLGSSGRGPGKIWGDMGENLRGGKRTPPTDGPEGDPGTIRR